MTSESGAYVVVFEERSDEGPRLVGPFPTRDAAWEFLDAMPPMDYSESHVEALHAPSASAPSPSEDRP